MKPEQCLDIIVKRRWPHGIRCPTCQQIRKFYKKKNRAEFICGHCRHSLYPMKGTIVEGTNVKSLPKWFEAIRLVGSDPTISVRQLQKHIGVTLKTAHRMKSRITGIER